MTSPQDPSSSQISFGQPRRPMAPRRGTQPDITQDSESISPNSSGISSSVGQFDSLQELLEQAGYKDTRVVTPQIKKMMDMTARLRSSTGSDESQDSPSTIRSVKRKDSSPAPSPRAASPKPPPPTASSSSNGWFSTLWRRASFGSLDKAAPASSSFPDGAETSQRVAKSSAPACQPETAAETSPQTPTKEPRLASATLKKAKSTADLSSSGSHMALWKGSKAFRDQQAEAEQSYRTLQTKSSLGYLRGGGNAGSVGIGISAAGNGVLKGLRRSGSRAAMAEDDQSADQAKVVHAPPPALTKSDSIEEWRRTLLRLKGSSRPAAIFQEHSDDVATPPRERPKAARAISAPSDVSTATTTANDLFASVAKPVVSTDAAVAPRNSDCFKGPDARGLRHTKSIEALRGALKAKKRSVVGQASQSRGKHQEEVPPVPALPSLPSDPELLQSLMGETTRTVYQDPMVDEGLTKSPPRPPPQAPPVLTLTSPSGVHSPQVVRLEGKEFDPSCSPEVTVSRGYASQLRDLIGGAGSREMDAGATRGRSRSRSRGRLSRQSSDSAIDASDDGGSASGASSSGSSLGTPRKTRRGTRGGRKHKSAAAKLAAANAALNDGDKTDADVEATTDQLLRRQSSTGSLSDVAKVQAVRKTASSRALQRSRSSGTAGVDEMPSFGSVLGATSSQQKHQEDDDDPFAAHVALQEAKKQQNSSVDSKPESLPKAVVNRGMASLLDENDENSSPLGSHQSRSSTPKEAVTSSPTRAALKGRIIGRARPVSPIEAFDEKNGSSAFAQTRREVFVPLMSSASNDSSPRRDTAGGHRSIRDEYDSPTRVVAARRLRKAKSTRAF